MRQDQALDMFNQISSKLDGLKDEKGNDMFRVILHGNGSNSAVEIWTSDGGEIFRTKKSGPAQVNKGIQKALFIAGATEESAARIKYIKRIEEAGDQLGFMVSSYGAGETKVHHIEIEIGGINIEIFLNFTNNTAIFTFSQPFERRTFDLPEKATKKWLRDILKDFYIGHCKVEQSRFSNVIKELRGNKDLSCLKNIPYYEDY